MRDPHDHDHAHDDEPEQVIEIPTGNAATAAAVITVARDGVTWEAEITVPEWRIGTRITVEGVDDEAAIHAAARWLVEHKPFLRAEACKHFAAKYPGEPLPPSLGGPTTAAPGSTSNRDMWN